MDDEPASLESQFVLFGRFMDSKRTGETITLWRSDYWMRQSKILEDRTVTMTDTGIAWFKFDKTELVFDEWYDVLLEVIEVKELDQEHVEFVMTNCGMPGGTSAVTIPRYRDFFENYKPKSKLIF